MFKDIYNSANNDIKPSPYLAKKIFNASEKKSTRRIFYKYVPICASFIIIVAASSFLMTNHRKNNEQPMVASTTNSTEEIAFSGANMQNRSVASLNGAAKPEARYSIEKEIAFDEAFVHAGISLDSIYIPDDLSPSFSADDVLNAETYTLSYRSSGTRSLDIEISLGVSNPALPDGDIQFINGKKVVFSRNENVILAYFIFDENHLFNITATDLTTAELDKIVSSITKAR